MLHDVHYMSNACRSVISISQLRDRGCHVQLLVESFTIQRGFLVLAQGHRGSQLTLPLVTGVKDAIVFVSPLPCVIKIAFW